LWQFSFLKTNTPKGEGINFMKKKLKKCPQCRKMLNSEDDTLFCLGEKIIKNKEGSDTVEMIWAKIFRTKSN